MHSPSRLETSLKTVYRGNTRSVARKEMTVMKEVHTKEVHNGKNQKNVPMQNVQQDLKTLKM